MYNDFNLYFNGSSQRNKNKAAAFAKGLGTVAMSASEREAHVRYARFIQQVAKKNFTPLKNAVALVAQGLVDRGYEPDMDRIRMNLIRNTSVKLFVGFRFSDIRDIVFTALSGADYIDELHEACQKCKARQAEGQNACRHCNTRKYYPDSTPQIYVYSPYFCRDNKPICVATKDEWAELLLRDRQSYYDIKFSEAEMYRLNCLLKESTPWLTDEAGHAVGCLRDLVVQAKFTLESFTTYCMGIIDDIKNEGTWDIDLPVTEYVYDGKGIYEGIDKPVTSFDGEGNRITNTFSGRRKMMVGSFYTQYKRLEVAPSDIVITFLSLTYYEAVGIKPLLKMAWKPCEGVPGYTELVAVSNDEYDDDLLDYYNKQQDLVGTPIYTTQDETLNKLGTYSLNNMELR